MDFSIPKTPFLILKTVLSFLLIFFYFGFLIKLRGILKSNGKELDNFMKATLGLLGISILLLQLTPLELIGGEQFYYPVLIIEETISVYFEKIAIFVDISRFAVIIIAIKRDG